MGGLIKLFFLRDSSVSTTLSRHSSAFFFEGFLASDGGLYLVWCGSRLRCRCKRFLASHTIQFLLMRLNHKLFVTAVNRDSCDARDSLLVGKDGIFVHFLFGANEAF